MTFWTLENLAEACGASLRSPPGGKGDGTLRGAGTVSIDTRTLEAGQVYVALRGENHDGHDYVEAAFAAGAKAAVVDADWVARRAEPGGGEGTEHILMTVPNALVALQRLAAAYRDHLRQRGCRVIAVAGSNGKTTTRNMIHTLLSSRWRGTQSPKSFNNHIGVPLTLLGAGEDDDFVVVEVGTNHIGEVAALGEIVRPDAAVVTSIGHEHMEHFGTLDQVAKEEFSILEFVMPGGVAVVPQKEAERLAMIAGEEDTESQAHERIAFADDDPVVPGDLPLPGAHNRSNAAAAAAIGRWFGLSDAEISEGLRELKAVPGRLERIRVGDVMLLHDAYNANPDSMREALKVLATEPGQRRVAVLGDMLELGEAGAQLHRETAEQIVELGQLDRVFTIGPLSTHTAEALRQSWDGKRVEAFAELDGGACDAIAAALEPGDVVLLKGSRGMRLERLLPVVEKRFGGDKHS